MDENPLVGEPPESIDLENSPLVKVIVQVRFSEIMSVRELEFIADFQEEIREEYPKMREQETTHFNVDLDGEIVNRDTSAVRHFSDSTESWTVSLASNFVAIETSEYKNRKDLLERLKIILQVLKSTIKPDHVDRIGVRYIDIIKGQQFEELDSLVRLELIGVRNTTTFGGLMHGLTTNLFTLDEEQGKLIGRWGFLPAGTAIDNQIEIDSQSWILDLDAHSNDIGEWDTEDLVKKTESLAKRVSKFFRWSIQEEKFFNTYGVKK